MQRVGMSEGGLGDGMKRKESRRERGDRTSMSFDLEALVGGCPQTQLSELAEVVPRPRPRARPHCLETAGLLWLRSSAMPAGLLAASARVVPNFNAREGLTSPPVDEPATP